MKTGKNTIYKGIRELQTNDGLREGRIRRKGGGRKSLLNRHPEWIDALKGIIESIYTRELGSSSPLVVNDIKCIDNQRYNTSFYFIYYQTYYCSDNQ